MRLSFRYNSLKGLGFTLFSGPNPIAKYERREEEGGTGEERGSGEGGGEVGRGKGRDGMGGGGVKRKKGRFISLEKSAIIPLDMACLRIILTAS